MLLQEIIDYLRPRSGDADDATLIASINNTWKQLWHTLDTESALFEMDVKTDANRIIALPPYVYQVKGVKRFSGDAINIFTPRAYYQEFNYRQHSLEWRELRKAPLFRSLNPSCQLRLSLKKANGAAFTVTCKGPGMYGVNELEEITFSAADTEHTTQAVYSDLVSLAKSAATDVDVNVYDANSNLVGVLSAERTDTWCIHMRVVDKNITPIANTNFYYTLLYKSYAPVFRSAADVLPDDWGIVLQQAAAAERLSENKDEDDIKRANRHEGKVDKFIKATDAHHKEGKEIRAHLSPNPFVSTYSGYL